MNVLFFRDHYRIFSGGMPRANYGDRHCVSVIHGSKHVTLDFTSRVIDFFVVCKHRHNTGKSLFGSCHFYLLLLVIIKSVKIFGSINYIVFVDIMHQLRASTSNVYIMFF